MRKYLRSSVARAPMDLGGGMSLDLDGGWIGARIPEFVAPVVQAATTESLAISVQRHSVPEFRRAPEAVWVEAMPSGFTGLTATAQVPAPSGVADFTGDATAGTYAGFDTVNQPRLDQPVTIKIGSVAPGATPSGLLFEAGAAWAGLAASFDGNGNLVFAAGEGSSTDTGTGTCFLTIDSAWFANETRDIWLAADPTTGRMRVYVVDPATDEILTVAQGEAIGGGLGALVETLTTDNFDRANETLTASTDWTAIFDRLKGAGTAEIVTNRVESVATARRSEMIHVFDAYTGGAAQVAQVVVADLSGQATVKMGPGVLFQNAGDYATGYVAEVLGDGSSVRIARVDGDSGTTDLGIYHNYLDLVTLATTSASVVNGDTIRLETDGAGALTLKINGAPVLTATDTTYTSGKPGFYWFHSREEFSVAIDDFAAGEPGSIDPGWASTNGVGVGQVNDFVRAGVVSTAFTGSMGNVEIWGNQIPADFAADPPVRYDPEFHEIIYQWECVRSDGTTLSYTAPQNVPDEFKDASRRIGKMACFVIEKPGDWSIKCTARQIKSLDPLTVVEVERYAYFTVGERLDVADDSAAGLWTATNTIVMAGDGDFTGAPAGHQVAYEAVVGTAWRAAVDAARAETLADGTRAIRILLKRGETTGAGFYNGNFLHDRDGTPGNENFDHIFVGTWGDASLDRPVTNGLDQHGFADKADELDTLIFDQIEVQGSLDHELRNYTGTDATKHLFFMKTRESALRLWNKVHLRDRWDIGFYVGDLATDPSQPSMTVINDCACDRITDYAVFGDFGDHTGVRMAVNGLRAIHPSNAPTYLENQGPGLQNRNHGPIRLDGDGDLVMDGLDLFCRMGWSGGLTWPDGTPATGVQPCMRLSSRNSATSTTGRIVVARSVGEGEVFCDIEALDVFELCRVNALLDSCAFVATHNGTMAKSEGGAITMRSNVMLHEAVAGMNPISRSFRQVLGARGATTVEEAEREPANIYGNSVYIFGDPGSTFNEPLTVDLVNATIDLNGIYAPDIAGQAGHEDLGPFQYESFGTPRYLGRWEGGQDVELQTQYATPATAMRLPLPKKGAGAVTGVTLATGATTLLDTLGQDRSRETGETHKGALTGRSKLEDLVFSTPALLFANGEQGAWYDPSDLSTLYQDSAGTTPVTADGDPVGRMEDKSGNGNHATQVTAAARPVYRTDGTLHWLEFDGVDDFLRADSLASSGFSLIYALEPTAPASLLGAIMGMGQSAPDRTVLYGNDNKAGPGGVRLFRDGPKDVLTENTTNQQGIAQILTVRSRNGEHDARRNSVQLLSSTQFVVQLPTGFTIGSAGDIGQFSNHKMFGAVFMEIKLDGTDLSNTESYLSGRTGITL